MTRAEYLNRRYNMAPFFGEQLQPVFFETHDARCEVLISVFVAHPETGEEVLLQARADLGGPSLWSEAIVDRAILDALSRLVLGHLSSCLVIDRTVVFPGSEDSSPELG